MAILAQWVIYLQRKIVTPITEGIRKLGKCFKERKLFQMLAELLSLRGIIFILCIKHVWSACWMLRPEDAEGSNVSVFTENWDLVMWLQGYQFQNWELEGGLLCQGFSFNRVVYTPSVRIKKNLDQSHPKTKDWVYELNAKVHETPKSEPSKDIIFSLIHKLKMKPLQIQVMAISILKTFLLNGRSSWKILADSTNISLSAESTQRL